MDGKVKDSIRFKTMPLSKIDQSKLGQIIKTEWTSTSQDRNEFLLKREDYTANWRDLNGQPHQGPWENSSNFNVPITLFYGKAIHARLWQIFSYKNSFFGVRARKEVFAEKEESIRTFMQFVLNDYANGKNGIRDQLDKILWDNVFDGSGYVKVYWQRDEHKYLEVVPVAETREKTIFDQANLTGRTEFEVIQKEEEQIRTESIETPQLRRCLMEDVILPAGQDDPQEADYVIHRVFMTAEQLKARAREGKFDEDVVRECLEHQSSFLAGDQDVEIKRERFEQDGIDDWDGYYKTHHPVLERYGKIYVKRDIDGDEATDYEETAEEAIVWVHQATGKVLGWTYLFRVSPSGIRPIFKFDFIKFPDRSTGVGVGEVLQSTQQSINAVYNLRQDNGMLASTPFGFYRSAAGLKPDKYRIEPGLMIPTDNPQQDVRVVQMPFLQGFGYQEEEKLIGYAERLLSISDLQIKGSSDKVGLFRTASGASAVQQESGIQLEIHFDRIARTMTKVLQCMFRLCRERMPSELYYRVTGEDGKPIFGKVNRDDLRGEYDFECDVDVLSQGRIEQQQSATLLLQTMMNPAFLQTGIVNPDNLYHMAKNFLIKNRISRPDLYVSEPPQYQGEPLRPEERVFRIVVGQFENPPIEDTVRLNDNHERALQIYDAFKESDQFGLLSNPSQVQALERLIAKHQQLLAAQQAGGNPNMIGMQTPREGMAPIEAMGQGAPTQGTLGAPMGEVNGPVF
jgi:hypothetical protein